MSAVSRTRRRRNPFFYPLNNPKSEPAIRPVLLVGVGDEGRDAVGRLNRPCIDEQPVIRLTDEDGPAKWHDAVVEARRHVGCRFVNQPADPLNVLVVGNERDVREFWNRANHLVGIEVQMLRKVALQLGDQPPSAVLPEDCYGWFHWTRHYARGDLTADQSRELASHMLRRGLAQDLTQFALQYRPDSVVTVGAACAWLPEITIGGAVASFLVGQAAQALSQPRPTITRPQPPLFTANSLDVLTERLRRVIHEHGRRFAWRLFGDLWKTSLPDLDDELAFATPAVIELAEGWVRGYRDTISRQLTAEFENASSLTAAVIRLREAIDRIEFLRKQIKIRIDSLAPSRRLVAQRVVAADRQRLAAHRQRLPKRLVCAVWRTVLTFLLLWRFLRLDCEQLAARLQLQSLEQLKSALTLFERRLTRLFEESGRRTDTLRAILEPTHPCLVPVHQAAMIETLIESFTASFLFSNGRTLLDELLRTTGPEILASNENSERSPWDQLGEVAGRLVRGSEPMSQSLVQICMQLLPQYRHQHLYDLLAQVAEPRRDVDSSKYTPAVSMVLAEPPSTGFQTNNAVPRLPKTLSCTWSRRAS